MKERPKPRAPKEIRREQRRQVAYEYARNVKQHIIFQRQKGGNTV